MGYSVLVHAHLEEPWVIEITPDALANLDLKEGGQHIPHSKVKLHHALRLDILPPFNLGSYLRKG